MSVSVETVCTVNVLRAEEQEEEEEDVLRLSTYNKLSTNHDTVF